MMRLKVVTVVCCLVFMLTTAYAQSGCYLTDSLVCYEDANKLNQVFKTALAAGGQNKQQIMAIIFSDVMAGQAILMQPGTFIRVDETNPIFAKISVRGRSFYTITDALRCK